MVSRSALALGFLVEVRFRISSRGVLEQMRGGDVRKSLGKRVHLRHSGSSTFCVTG